MKISTIAFVFACALPMSSSSFADSFRNSNRPSDSAMTPFPMQIFCSKQPSECLPSRSAVTEWSDDLATVLQSVNAQVNKEIRPKGNPKGGWKINPAAGDCNDYAITKRSRLIQLGVPLGALRMAVTATKDGYPHAILIVKTTAGDVVLDNLSSQIKSLDQTGYSIQIISSADPLRWTRGLG